jgi:hypothetical protein
MKFELIPVDEIPESIKKKRKKKTLKIDELEIEYIRRLTGKDITPRGIKK